ncbi:MAG: M1 family peptidase [Flavobacteriales bacterium]|nr:MAG: M1 family peptidase [Flavobacteriales bacterium]|tara:strand:- start:1306 stop:2961 length:1656 start_codon:yes stop_codon:yes gene_type:complete
MSRSFIVLNFLLFILSIPLTAQGIFQEKNDFTRQDSLRGMITAERSWWDLNYYHLDIKVDPENKSIKGSNTVGYKVLKSHNLMQIDLQEPMHITSVKQNNKSLDFSREGNAYFIKLKRKQKPGKINYINIEYEGNPKVAIRAPWDGGLSWEKDENGIDFIATSCQGLGASVWWPNKDHMYDEVDSMLMSVNVPKHLVNVSNGRLRNIIEKDDNTKTYEWFVSNPINNYGVNINIGDYVNFSEKYDGEKGILDIDYYVLRDNLEKAKEQFKQVPMMLDAFEHWFGPYPFYEDSFKLVEVPYLGMEHQSSITYGNKYMQGYLGRDLSRTGWGLKFDYIIIHESGHEWFANNITYKDIADMWVHEGFTCYSENLYVDYHFGKEASADYVIGSRRGIGNRKPIIGPYNVNREGSGDMYSKGANLLHTLRQIAKDDQVWRKILRGLNKEFYHQTVTSKQIENYISENIGFDLSYVFDQYLRDYRIPVLEYTINEGALKYRWGNTIDGFNMPIEVTIDDVKQLIYPENTWKETTIKEEFIKIDRDYYVFSKDLRIVE